MPERAEPTSVERRYGWVIVITSLLMMTVGSGGYFIVLVGLKLVAQDFDGLRWVPASAYSATVFGMGLGGIFIGRWSDRFGVGGPALLGSAMVVAGAWLAGTTTDRWVFLFAHGALMGLVGNAAMFSPLLANATRWFDRRRGVAVSIVASSQGLAGLVWPVVFRRSIESVGWRESYLWFGWLALATMIPLSFLLRPRAPTSPERSDGEAGAATGLPIQSGLAIMVLLCAAIVGCCIAMAMPIVHVVAHATDLGHSLARSSEVLTVLLGSAFFSRIAWGVVSDRIGGMRVLLTCSALQATGLAAYLVVDGLAGLYVVSAFFGLAFGGIIPSYALVLARYFSLASMGVRIAVVYLFGAIGMAIGGWLGGALFDATGTYGGAFAVGLVANVVNLGIVGSLFVRGAPVLRTASA